MSYHDNKSPEANRKSALKTQVKTAPEGYHYMPDGTLMSDAEHDFLDTNRGICVDIEKFINSSETSWPKWGVCAISSGEVMSTGPFSWIGSFAFLGCPLNPLPPLTFPYSYNTVHFIAFYNWVVQELGPVNIGDEIEIDMTNTAPPGSPGNAPLDGTSGIGMCEFDGVNNVDKICLEYLGGGATYGTGWNGPYMTLGRNCCSGFTQYSNCTLIDLMNAAVATVHPVYTTAPNGNGATLFSQFTTRMWDHYLGNLPGPTGCAWWLNRYTHWSNQLLNLGPVINPFQLALKTAKIDFALLMITACGCTPPPPASPTQKGDMPPTPPTPPTPSTPPTPPTPTTKTYIHTPEVKDSKDVVDVDSATLDKLIAAGADIEIL